MKKIKVFQFLPSLSIGGAEKLVIDLSTHLDKELYDVTIVALFEPEANIYYDLILERRLRFLSLHKRLGLDLGILFKLYKLLKKEKPEIIHTHTYSVAYVLLPSLLNKVKIKIHTVHNVAGKELSPAYRKIMYLAYRFFKIYPVAISELVKRTIYEEYKLDSSKVPCIYNGINTLEFSSYKSKKPLKTIELIHVGRFSKQKNHAMLIDAFRMAVKINPKLRLTLVGDGELKEFILRKVEAEGLSEVVKFTGITKDIPRLLNDSHIFLLSSSWEGLPLSVLEAMSCSLPIIATKTGGVPDIVVHGENGLLVATNDTLSFAKAILKLSDDELLRNGFALKSKELSKKYDVKRMTNNYSELYKSLMSKQLMGWDS